MTKRYTTTTTTTENNTNSRLLGKTMKAGNRFIRAIKGGNTPPPYENLATVATHTRDSKHTKSITSTVISSDDILPSYTPRYTPPYSAPQAALQAAHQFNPHNATQTTTKAVTQAAPPSLPSTGHGQVLLQIKVEYQREQSNETTPQKMVQFNTTYPLRPAFLASGHDCYLAESVPSIKPAQAPWSYNCYSTYSPSWETSEDNTSSRFTVSSDSSTRDSRAPLCPLARTWQQQTTGREQLGATPRRCQVPIPYSSHFPRLAHSSHVPGQVLESIPIHIEDPLWSTLTDLGSLCEIAYAQAVFDCGITSTSFPMEVNDSMAIVFKNSADPTSRLHSLLKTLSQVARDDFDVYSLDGPLLGLWARARKMPQVATRPGYMAELFRIERKLGESGWTLWALARQAITVRIVTALLFGWPYRGLNELLEGCEITDRQWMYLESLGLGARLPSRVKAQRRWGVVIVN